METTRRTVGTIYQLFLVAVILFAAYKLYDAYMQLYRGSDEYYQTEFADAMNGEVDIEALQEINPDIVGWLSVEGTGIALPVLQDRALHADYAEDGVVTLKDMSDIPYPRTNQLYRYLFYDFRGRLSSTGSITIDYRNALEDPYLLIYGHNVEREGMMFSNLLKFEDEAFFSLNGEASLYGAEGKTDMQLLACAIVDGFAEEIFRIDPQDSEFSIANAVRFIEGKALCLSEAALSGRAYGRYIVLSTCYTDPEDVRRFVVLYGAE